MTTGVDEEKRSLTTRNHSATHILHDSLRTIQLIIGSVADSILEVKGESKDKKETGSIVDDKVANVSTETSKESSKESYKESFKTILSRIL